jgi:hypothetical protein
MSVVEAVETTILPRRQRRISAARHRADHEAGHAAAFLSFITGYFNGDARDIEPLKTKDKTKGLVVRGRKEQLVSLAGPEAERRLDPGRFPDRFLVLLGLRSRHQLPDDGPVWNEHDDHGNVLRWLIGQHPKASNGELLVHYEGLVAEARALLAREWRVVEFAADQLLHHPDWDWSRVIIEKTRWEWERN